MPGLQAQGHSASAIALQPGVPLDNNQAECDLSPLVVARTISGGSSGSPTHMQFSTLFATGKVKGLGS